MVDVLQNFTTIMEKPGKYSHYAERYLPKILAILMLVFVVTDLEYTLSNYDMSIPAMMEATNNMPLQFYSDIIVLGFAIVILAYKRISNSKAISLYLLSLSLSRMMTYSANLFSLSDFEFMTGILMCTLSLNMFITGVFFFRGISRNRRSVMASSVIIAMFYVLSISYNLHNSPDPLFTVLDNMSYIVQFVLYLVLLATLDTYDVFINSNEGRVDNSIRELNGRTGATERTVLSEEEARVIYNGFGNMDGWTRVDDGTPVEYQYSVIISMGDSNSEMLLQKWRGSEKIHFTIANSFTGSVIYASRFSAVRCFFESDIDDDIHCIRFVNEEGEFIRFRIMNALNIDMLHKEVCNET